MDKMIAERYMLVSLLGEGGMADVYLAIDTILNREVAIKILRGELSKDPVTLLRFQREASAVSKLNHPNVVDVYDVGEYEGKHYIVMEYIRGRTLKQLISQRGALHKEEAVNIMKQLTSAVEHAHENHIIHRDIKPQNILVKDDGTIKITDFGIALAHDAVQLTQNDAVLGSAHYLAPETTRGEAPTVQVDIYALGIVFYELLTGSVPFKGDNPVQIAMKHLREEIPSVCEFNPTLPQAVENIILRATVKNREQRYHSAKEMLYDLECCLKPEYAHVDKLKFTAEDDPTRIMHKETAESFSLEEEKTKRLNKTIVIAVSLICVVIAAVLLWFAFGHEKSIMIPNITTAQTKQEAIKTLTESGFEEENIEIKEELSDNIEKGYVIKVSPKVGEKARVSQTITLSISRGTYFVMKDYRNEELAQVEAELKAAMPKLKLHVTKEQRSGILPGRILAQSGIDIGEKLDPEKEYTLNVTVSEHMQYVIEGIIGLPYQEAVALIEEKTGVKPVLEQLDASDLSEEEKAKIKPEVVVEVDPKEGTAYTQDGESVITIRFY